MALAEAIVKRLFAVHWRKLHYKVAAAFAPLR